MGRTLEIMSPSDPATALLLGLFDEALASLDSARRQVLAMEALAVSLREPVGDALRGRAWLLLAEAQYEALNYAASYEAALKAAELSASGGDEDRRALAANLCLVICIETGDVTRALEYARTELADARRAGDAARVARLMHNQAAVFDIMEELDAAVACLVEAAQIQAALPGGAHEAFFARVNLAQLHLARSERLAPRDPQASATAGQSAREALPPIDWDADLAALQTWIAVKAGLGDVEIARAAALDYTRLVRRAGRSSRHAVYALLASAECHLHAGRPDKAAVRFEGAVARLREARNSSHLAMLEERQAEALARAGQPARALGLMRKARADRARLADEQHRLRTRLAAAEGEGARRHAQRRELQAHVQRMAVIGRMISEIHHALVEPLEQVQGLIAPWVAGEVAGARRPVSARALGQVIASIDAATALARQLKMFSYRAAPQPMDIELVMAIRNAWSGLALWRPSATRPLVLDGGIGALVWADAQRLGVLLSILLIEVDASAPGNDVRIRVSAGPEQICMHIRTGSLAAADARIGFTLCEEIAREMSGSLSRKESAAAPRVRYRLCLPVTGTQRAATLRA